MESSLSKSLAIAGVANIAIGLAFSVAAVVAPGALATLVGLAATDASAVSLAPTALFAFGIVGGLMVGLGAMIVGLTRGVAAADAIAVGVLAWFVVDSAASVATGYAWNVVGNLGFAMLFLPAIVGLVRKGGRVASAPRAAV